MKKKVVKISGDKNAAKKAYGHGTFRVTGPGKYHPNSGVPRIVIWVKGTREFAESIDLSECENNQVIEMESK